MNLLIIIYNIPEYTINHSNLSFFFLLRRKEFGHSSEGWDGYLEVQSLWEILPTHEKTKTQNWKPFILGEENKGNP